MSTTEPVNQWYPAAPAPEFCPECGTGLGKHFRPGEIKGSCCMKYEPAPDVDAIMALAAAMATEVARDWQADTYERGGPQDQAAAALRAAVEQIVRDRDTLKELYDAKYPPHERRKGPSMATASAVAEAEADPVMLYQQSFWPDCRCMECYAIHRVERAERELTEALDANAKFDRRMRVLDEKLFDAERKNDELLAKLRQAGLDAYWDERA